MIDLMATTSLVVIIMSLGIPIVAIICATIVSIAKKGSTKKDDPEQARMIQEIYNGLERMEHRIESLETILYEKKDGRHE